MRDAAQPHAAANAGKAPRLLSDALGPAWLRWSFGKAMTDDPQAHKWKDLRRFYTDLVFKHGWKHVAPLLEALDVLLALREERGLFTFTSHEVLTFTAHPKYPAWFEDDTVSIAPLRSGKVEVSYVHRRGLPSEESMVIKYDALIPTVDAMVRRLTTA